MSGHSKWSTIKRQKGANDAKRGQAFTKMSKAITMAVRQGGGIADPESNFKLRLAIDVARSANMPKDTIDRAIQRATGKSDVVMHEAIYEGFGNGGFSVIVEAITDNKQRTTPEIKSLFDKHGGTLGVPGSVQYKNKQKGEITVKKDGKTLDDIFMLAAEGGADDVEDAEDEVVIYTSPELLSKVRQALVNQGVIINQAEIVYKPIVTKPLSAQEVEKAISFLEKIEDHDDVQKVYANFIEEQ
ncbi:MAG: YebC/PmpR family DNA-binding transcriptional regulator [Candidatus Levybacteria bacterium]|nr:YebC/PmpR family DNA-binding transcriptional regulator [Candidatus Levybacteria bacterium]